MNVGDLLLDCDITAIQQAGFETTTPIIIANTPNYTKIEAEHNGVITAGGPLLKLYS